MTLVALSIRLMTLASDYIRPHHPMQGLLPTNFNPTLLMATMPTLLFRRRAVAPVTGVAMLNIYTVTIITGWRCYRGTIIRFTFFVYCNRTI